MKPSLFIWKFSSATILSCTTTAFNLPVTRRQATALYAVDVSESAARDIPSLLEWSTNVGIQYDLTLTTSGDDDTKKQGVYVIATRDIPAESCVLYVPNDVIIRSSSMQQFDNTAANLDPSELSPFSLFLQILQQYELDGDSPYYSYLNSLPRYYTNGASMTDFCFGCLPPYAAGLALEDKNRFKKYANALDSVNFLSEGCKRHKDVTRWAYNAIFTRCQELPGGELCLIPMVDYLNHGGVHSNSFVTFDDEGNAYVYTTCNIAEGEAITLCYGDPNDPSALLARYGFLDDSSEATFCKYVITNPNYEVCNLGYPSSMLFYKDGSISQEVWDVILYQELAKSQNEQQTFYQACMAGDEELKQSYHNQYFTSTLEVLQKHVSYLYQELEEMSEFRWRKDISRHPRLPLLLKHNEHVRGIFEVVQEYLDTMSMSV